MTAGVVWRVAAIGAVAVAGVVMPATSAHGGVSQRAACVAEVTRFEYAPELCGGTPAERSWVLQGFRLCTAGWLPAAGPGQVQVRPGRTGNGNCMDGVASAVMAWQGLDLSGRPLPGGAS